MKIKLGRFFAFGCLFWSNNKNKVNFHYPLHLYAHLYILSKILSPSVGLPNSGGALVSFQTQATISPVKAATAMANPAPSKRNIPWVSSNVNSLSSGGVLKPVDLSYKHETVYNFHWIIWKYHFKISTETLE